jgi:plastocyanin
VRRRATLGLAAGLAVFALSAGSGSAATHEVNANGNIFTGGLSFSPATVKARVGDKVRWTNTDFLVPHTATEDNDLWDLTGTYGQTPLSPPGFGPGESRERVFEAGTFSYYCRVHPMQMKGVIQVAPIVKRTGTASHPRLRVTWAPAPPADGQVFDVQRKLHGGWHLVRNSTARQAATFLGEHGIFRARMRAADPRIPAPGYSPAVRR